VIDDIQDGGIGNDGMMSVGRLESGGGSGECTGDRRRGEPEMCVGDDGNEGRIEVDVLKEEVNYLKRKIGSLEEEKNNAKRKILRLEAEKMERETSISALTFRVRTLEEGERELAMRNRSMDIVKQQMKAVPKSTKNKGLKVLSKLSSGVPEKYLGVVLELHSKMDGILVKEVFEMDPFGKHFYRRWEGRGIVGVTRGVSTKCGKIVCPYSPVNVCGAGSFFLKGWPHTTMLIEDMTRHHLEGSNGRWVELMETDSVLHDTIRGISECKALDGHVAGRLRFFTSYVKRVLRDTLFDVLGYGMLVSRTAIQTEDDRRKKAFELTKAMERLMPQKMIDGVYDMGWWRTCVDEMLISNVDLTVVGEDSLGADDVVGGCLTVVNPVSNERNVETSIPQGGSSGRNGPSGSSGAGNCFGRRLNCGTDGANSRGSMLNMYDVADEGGSYRDASQEQLGEDDEREGHGDSVCGSEKEGEQEDEGGEEMYGLFRNSVGKRVWESYVGTLKNFVEENLADGQDLDDVDPEMEWSICSIARIDAWFMTVIDCLGFEEVRGGGRQKRYVQKYEEYLPLAMRQLSRSLYMYVRKWEPNDLKVWFGREEEDDVG